MRISSMTIQEVNNLTGPKTVQTSHSSAAMVRIEPLRRCTYSERSHFDRTEFAMRDRIVINNPNSKSYESNDDRVLSVGDLNLDTTQQTGPKEPSTSLMSDSKPPDTSSSRPTLKLKAAARKSPREFKTAEPPRAQSKLSHKPGAALSDELKRRMQEDMDALLIR
jgi:hypothetical protein